MLTVAVFAVAFLYSCVGHAGASGYIAAMFILVNSAAGLLGSARLPHAAIKRLLAAVLLIAGVKLIFA